MSGSKIDPRLRKRRIDVHRQRGRRRLRRLLILIGLAAVAALLVLLARSELLDVDRITVQGVDGPRADQVRMVSGLTLGEPLITADIGRAKQAVSALPWVRTVDGSRRWPSTVRLTVTPREPFAVMVAPDGVRTVVDADGVAIELLAGDSSVALPQIRLAADGSLGAIQVDALPLLALIDQVPADLMPWIDGFSRETNGSEPLTFTLDLVGSAVVDLGYNEDLPAKLEALRAILGRVDRRCMAEIDLQVAELPSVTRDPVCEAQLP